MRVLKINENIKYEKVYSSNSDLYKLYINGKLHSSHFGKHSLYKTIKKLYDLESLKEEDFRDE